jgi:hypothetical protein
MIAVIYFALILFLSVSSFATEISSTENIIIAQDPRIWSVGRTNLNDDGSISFNWENTQFLVNVRGIFLLL